MRILRLTVPFVLLVATAMECPGERGAEPDFTVTNRTETTIELTLDSRGAGDRRDELDVGEKGRYFLGEDATLKAGKVCEDMDLVARDSDGRLIVRRRGPICRGLAWTVVSP